MTTLAELERLLHPEPSDAQIASELRKALDAGRHWSKEDLYKFIEDEARVQQQEGESFERSFTRLIEKSATGLALYAA